MVILFFLEVRYNYVKGIICKYCDSDIEDYLKYREKLLFDFG